MWYVLVVGLSMPMSPLSIEALKRIAVTQATQTPDPAPAVVSAPSHEKWPYGVMLAGQGADAATTVMAHNHPGLEERNPIGYPGVLGLKAASVGAAAYLMHAMQSEGHTKAARVTGMLTGLAGAIPAAWNARLLYQHRGDK